MSGTVKSVFAIGLLFAIFYGSTAAAQPAPRIVGGTEVTDDRYPFMVAIFSAQGDPETGYWCGGTLIGSRWVLTAAHCLMDYSSGEQLAASEITLTIGARDLRDPSQVTPMQAMNIYAHPDFSLQPVTADIGLIELPVAVDTPVLSLPAAGSDVPTVDEPATATGWGYNSEQYDLSLKLQEISVPVVAYANCLPFYFHAGFQLQLDRHVCAGGVVSGSPRNLCEGDSGGPLLVERAGRWVQAGVASYGQGCFRTSLPTVFTRVSYYLDWLTGFVPDLEISNGGSGMLDGPGMLNESAVFALSPDTPTVISSLLQSEFAIYEVTGATRVDLRLASGFTGFMVFAGTTFEASAIVCSVDSFTPLQSCDLPGTSQRLFAVVPAYEDSRFAITASGFAVTNGGPTVSGNTISWPDNGWYQVLRVTDEGIIEVCAGGRSCEVAAGSYIVINHTTGQRFENVIVEGGMSESESAVMVSGNTISWPDDGWYQVLRVTDEGIIEVCAGGRSCEVPAGSYIVINHTTGQRFEGVIVDGGMSESESTVMVSGNTISWPDDGWYQVQQVTDEGIIEVCAGGRSCEVPAGSYIVINHTTGQRFEDVIVNGGMAESESTVMVSGNTISWPDDGWYQVQQVTDDGIIEVCAGGRSCEVPAGSYIVINHTTGQRFEPVIVSSGVAPTDSGNVAQTAAMSK